MQCGNMARTLTDIPATVLVSVVLTVLIACQEKVHSGERNSRMRLTSIVALLWIGATHFAPMKDSHPGLDSVLMDKSFGSHLKD